MQRAQMVASSKVAGTSMSRSLARRAAAVRPMQRCHSTSENRGEEATTSGTIFYAGSSYTEDQWQQAIKSGKVGVNGSPITAGRTAVTNSTLDTLVEVMAFSGPGPEIINGRLAMLGFVTAAAAELASGQGILAQWRDAQTPITLTFVLFMAASLVPFIKGDKDKVMGPFNPQAEMLNGRAAMLGFALLLGIEAVKGSALL